MSRFPPLAPNAWLRWDTVSRLLRSNSPIRRIIEIGTGQGGFAARLATTASEYTGYEPDPKSWRIATERIRSFPNGLILQKELPSEPVVRADLVCAFEVLEHLEDDHAALRSWFAWVAPGGCLLVSVPSRPSAFGRWDRAVGHYRRYTAESLEALFLDSGCVDVTVRGYGFPLGLLLDWVRNHLLPVGQTGGVPEATSRSGRVFQPRDWMAPVVAAAIWPFRLVQRLLPRTSLNTGLVAVGWRPSGVS
jgi:SAM-dependent methyltransferase